MAGNINNILHYLLLLRNQMKIYHWQTKSYARHKASDDLVSDIDSLTDKYIEAYSGIYQNIVLNNEIIKLDNITDISIIHYLVSWRKIFIDESIKFNNPELLNIRDEILNIIDRTLYLFRLE